MSADSGHGPSPAARACAFEQTSPATMQMPSRIVCTTCLPIGGAPTAGPARTKIAAMRAIAATYSMVA